MDPRARPARVALVVLFGCFAVALHGDGFTSSTNLLNIVRQTAPITVMAVAVVFVLSAGEIDLSLGSVVALSALGARKSTVVRCLAGVHAPTAGRILLDGEPVWRS